MNDDIRRLVHELADLEEELREKLHQQETRVLYKLEGTRVEFETSVRQAHETMRTNVLAWLKGSSWRNLASAPAIYSLIIPFALLDLFVSAYQWLCFPLYRIPRVRRRRYIVLDRHHLRYLNSIQRLNCVYCGYINGLIAYVREVASRTEQYWCPIKHARRVTGSHRRYADFLDYGDAEDFDRKLAELREQLRQGAA
ncbi:MAG: hypothetical protein U5K56_10625 [Halioglobus sp.]|nr:hypothetical protein [Halioglobus sp.]